MCTHKPVGGESWSFQDTIQLPNGEWMCPRISEFPWNRACLCTLEHFRDSRLPWGCLELSCSSPSQSLLTKHSRLRAELDRIDFSVWASGSRCHSRLDRHLPEGKPSGSREENGWSTFLGEEGLLAPEKELIHLACGHLNLGRRRLFARKPLIASLLTQSPVFSGTEGEGGREDLQHSRNQH